MFKFFLHSFSSTSNCLNYSPLIRPPLKNYPIIISNRKPKCPSKTTIISVPNFPFFFILTVAIFLILSSNLPMANALGRRRMCGQVLTQELARICTKPGTRGPCLHGHIQTPTKRGGFISESQQLAPKFAHQMLRFLQPREFNKRNNKRMVAEENDATNFSQNFHSSLKTTPNNHRFIHPILHLMLRKPINSPEYSSSFIESLHHRPKRDGGGIAHHCCTGNGCDDAFLDSFCCDEEEEKAFRAINS